MNKFFQIIVSSLFLGFSSANAEIERVSVSSSGEQANSRSSNVSLSGDGRFVAFGSYASNLVEFDTHGESVVYLHDRKTGETEHIAGGSFATHTGNPSISTDGQYVAYRMSNSVGVIDRISVTGGVVDVSPLGGFNAYSTEPSISGDGRFMAFSFFASHIKTDDTNRYQNIFVHDRNTGIFKQINIPLAGVQGHDRSDQPSISANGRVVVFRSKGSNLVDSDTNSREDIFSYDRATGATERVSVSSSGGQSNGNSHEPSPNADGRFIAFHSGATNLVDGDTNGVKDVFVHDRTTHITERVSVSSFGAQGNSSSYNPSISADGRFLTFESDANNLVEEDTNGMKDIFIHDRNSGVTVRANLSSLGVQANAGSQHASIGGDGQFVAFESYASNLVDSDANSTLDIFVVENPFIGSDSDLITVEKLINNETRAAFNDTAKLQAGTLYKQSYKVTNNSTNRIFQVKVFECGNLVCNFYALDPDEMKERCISYQTVLEGDQHAQPMVTAKMSGSGEVLTNKTDAYYTGLTNVSGELRVTHHINNINADSMGQAPTLSSQQATVSFKIENTGEIELYQVKTYHDPVSPVNSGWAHQCLVGPLKPGQVRYCKRDITFIETGLNQAMGRVQGRNAIRSATGVVNSSNPTYFIVP